MKTNKISPLAWIPTLYFAQGIPYFIVNNISVLMLAKMGVPNGKMALSTLDDKANMESVYRHIKNQEMVDNLHANNYVGSLYTIDSYNTAPRRCHDSIGKHTDKHVHHHITAIYYNSLCKCHS